MEDLANYQQQKLTIDLVWANVFAILILIPILIVFGLPYYFIWLSDMDSSGLGKYILQIIDNWNGFYIFGVIIIGLLLHELIHGITWAIFIKNGFKSIKFGILWKMLTPYCHCKEPLIIKHYILGAITPAIILGFIPSILALILGDFELLLFGILFIMSAGGDFLVINLLWKENSDDVVQDHPSEAGCMIYRKI
jgi:hypothetical protein